MAGPDDPVSFNRRSADLIGREIKNMRGRGRGEQPLPRRRRATDGGDGGSSTLTTNFGIVIAEAEANKGSIGYYIPLDENFAPIVPVDPGDPEYDVDDITDNKLPFYSAHQYSKCPEGERIQVIRFEGGHTNFGLLTDCVVELSTRTGFASNTALVGSSDPDGILWAGGTCPPAEDE